MRRRIDGSPDTTFSSDGAVGLATTHGFRYGIFHAVAQLADGRVIAAGTADDRILVVRFRADGALDRSFGKGSRRRDH
jgi:hypothetical protein